MIDNMTYLNEKQRIILLFHVAFRNISAEEALEILDNEDKLREIF